MTPDAHETVAQACAFLDPVGATAVVGVAAALDDTKYLSAKVFVGTSGALEVTTEPEARADYPLELQALSLASKLRDLAPQLTP